MNKKLNISKIISLCCIMAIAVLLFAIPASADSTADNRQNQRVSQLEDNALLDILDYMDTGGSQQTDQAYDNCETFYWPGLSCKICYISGDVVYMECWKLGQL